jgi:hypothetical protein
MPNNDDDGDGPTGMTANESKLTEMMNVFMERWGDASRKLQEASEDRLARVNEMAAALCLAVERTSHTADAQGDLCRLSLEAMTGRVMSIKADRDRTREQLTVCQRMLAESQMEVRRLTDIAESQQRTIDNAMRELARNGGGNTTNIGDVSGHKNRKSATGGVPRYIADIGKIAKAGVRALEMTAGLAILRKKRE